MSDWKSRATPVSDSEASDWKSRAEALPSGDDSDSSNLKDLGIGLGQGATLGFGDELLGGAQALKDVATGPATLADLADLYRKHQKENEAGVDAAKARSPWLVGGGELAGSLIPAALTMGGSAEAQGLGKLALKGAALGGLAGAGGSHGTVDQDPAELAKDIVASGGIGATAAPLGQIAAEKIAPVFAKGASAVGNKLSDMANDSVLMQKLAYAFNAAKDKGMSFTGEKAGNAIKNNLADTTKSVTDQVLQPLADARANYGQMLDTAAQGGAKLSQDPDLMGALKAAQERYSGGLTPEMEQLLNTHGATSTDPNTLQTLTSQLDPKQAKTLQNALRGLSSKTQYQDTNAINNLVQQLTPAIDQSLPPGQLAQANSLYKNAASVAEPFINKGETDPELQQKLLSDMDPDQLKGKINDYLTKLTGGLKDNGDTGIQKRADLQDIVQKLGSLNENAGAKLVDPNQISSQLNEAGLQNGVLKGIYGERGATTPGISNLADKVIGSPYRAASGAGGAIRGLSNISESTGISRLGRSLYNAPDDILRPIAEKLKAAGATDIGTSLTNALDSKSDAAKNAALFTIMQNPKYRQMLPDASSQDEGNQ